MVSPLLVILNRVSLDMPALAAVIELSCEVSANGADEKDQPVA